nr:leucine-rich repeat domain-containing protein [Lachnospiraceae bacterium]
MAGKTSKKKNTTKKKGRRYLKKAARRTIAALLMVTALIVAAIPATPSRAATFGDVTSDYVYVNEANGYLVYLTLVDSKVSFTGFESIDVQKIDVDDGSGTGTTVTHTIIKKTDAASTSIELTGTEITTVYSDLVKCTVSGYEDYYDLYTSTTAGPVTCVSVGNGSESSSHSSLVNYEKIKGFTCDTVTTFNNYAFEGCTSLDTINCNSAVSIGDSAFSGCDALANLTLGSPFTKVGSSAFKNCVNLSVCPINGVVLKNGLGESAFEGCTSMSGEVNLCCESSTLTLALAGSCFKNCTGISTVKIADGYTIIQADAFNGCTSLSKISLPNTLQTVGDNVFLNCTSLTAVSIPAGMTALPAGIFNSCESLKDVYLRNNGNT